MATPVDTLRQNATALTSLAHSLVSYRLAHPEFSDADKNALVQKAMQLSDDASVLYDQALKMNLSAITPHLDALSAATAQLQEELNSISNVAHAISIATGAVTLCVAVSSGNPAAIATALASV